MPQIFDVVFEYGGVTLSIPDVFEYEGVKLEYTWYKMLPDPVWTGTVVAVCFCIKRKESQWP